MRTRLLRVTALTLLLMIALIAPASAYIDPSTTTVIFQVAVAGVAAAGMAMKIFWSRIVGFFTRGSRAAASSDEVAPTAEPVTDVPADH